MGRKKSFIDKKRATKFQVVYKEHEDGDDPFEFVSHDQMRQRADEADAAAGSRHPMSFMYDDDSDAPPSEEERQDIIGMGLPDDGYNYLKHMRAAGTRRQMLIIPTSIPEDEPEDEAQQEEAGVPEFVPPPEDVTFIDASALPAPEVSEHEEAAEEHQRTVSAFSRNVHNAEKVAQLAAVRELAEMMAAMEATDDVPCDEGEEPDAVLGEGDLLDDFIASAQCPAANPESTATAAHPATLSPAQAAAAARREAARLAGARAAAADGSSSEEEFDSGEEDWALGEGAGQLVPAEEWLQARQRAGAEPRRGPASIADSFWRAPRNDRTDAQTVVDERLIARMDVEYNDDEIGSADEEADVDDGDVHSADGAGARPGWTADDARLQAALAEFRKGHRNGRKAELPLYFKMEGLTAEQLEQLDDETVARVQALAACRRFEAADEAAAERRGDDGPGAGMVRDVRALPPREERWDCESAVTTRSTLYNHPARLGQAGRRPARGQRGGAAAVMLSAKTGLPVERRPDRGGSGVSSEGGSDDGEAGVNLGAGRRKGESGGEKKARKATVKEARRAARQSKKENKRVYAEAGTSMQKHLAANREVHTTVVCLN